MKLDDTSNAEKIFKQLSDITRVEELFYELKLKDVMTSEVTTFEPQTKMQVLLDSFRQDRISGAPVLENNEIIGIISIEDLVKCLIDNDLSAPVSKYLTKDPVCLSGNKPVVKALKMFAKKNFGRFLITDDQGKLLGILTKGDISRGVLKALEKEYHYEEIRNYRARHLFEDIESDRTSLILRYAIKANDFIQGGAASGDIKKALLRLGAQPQIARRCGIAVYEAEMNLIIHTTNGGEINVEIEPNKISIEVVDSGPGIENVNLALKPGYSTAPENVRELGFGAGMGLDNIRRCVDGMSLESKIGEGTSLKMVLLLNTIDGES
ncbi:MAG: CBS domain-containing protein [Anaerolineaceae bacterium]|nr:CBS domain-containing protein [Anaerolineaceae bacterium]